jgi:uncharacterized protein (TIGR00255 family)
MIRSMTGYGQGSVELRGVRFQAEARSVNHRFLDLRLRVPGSFQSLEKEVREAVRGRLHRGRVELSATVIRPDDDTDIRLNDAVLSTVLKAASTLRDDHGLQGELDVATVLRVPGILREPGERVEPDDEDRAGILKAITAAVDALLQDRLREGAHLVEEILARLSGMSTLVDELDRHADRVPGEALVKLKARIEKLAADLAIDESRLAQEAALLADRSDVTEELVRLRSHLGQASRILSNPDGEPVGKRLDFLMQEIHRETNTINSKSSDLEISSRALTLKTEGDKVREQIQNLE